MWNRNPILGKLGLLAICGILSIALVGILSVPALADGKKDKKQDNPPPRPLKIVVKHVTKTRP